MSSLAAYQINAQSVSEKHKNSQIIDEWDDPRRPYSERMAHQMSIKIVESEEDELTFDLMGVDASIANALRRIMIAEVPTMAIEHVYIEMNSSIIHDEVLSHRLGLIPIKVDPLEFVERNDGEDPTSANTIVFSLDVTCPQRRPPSSSSSSTSSSDPYTMNVYSSQLVWCPQGEQQERFGANGIRPVHEDILIAKLRPGQSIKLEAHCQKGIGKDHAKFSPVATVSYRLMPMLDVNPDAEVINEPGSVPMHPVRVFDSHAGNSVKDLAEKKTKPIVLSRPRECTICRKLSEERRDTWADELVMARIPDHFIFKVESTGIMAPRDIVKHSLRILAAKCDSFVEVLESSMEPDGDAT